MSDPQDSLSNRAEREVDHFRVLWRKRPFIAVALIILLVGLIVIKGLPEVTRI